MTSTDLPQWLPDELVPAALRLVRADQLAFDLGITVMNWSKDTPYRIVEERVGQEYQVFTESVRPAPPLAALLFSEAVNHARAALDNVVWHLAEKAQGGIPCSAQPILSLPICDTPEALGKWQKRMRNSGLTCVHPDTELGKRIEAIQPFAESRVISSITEAVAAITGDAPEHANPLKLLQVYSNADKHRSIRLTKPLRRDVNPLDPLAPTRFEEVTFGVPFTRGQVGVGTLGEWWPTVLLERPAPFSHLVAPAMELSALVTYCLDVAVPTLCTGAELIGGIGLGGDLEDAPTSLRARIEPDGIAPASAWLKPLMRQEIREAEKAPPLIPEIREVMEFTGGRLP